MTTGTPPMTACHAASDPARPPPMMWMGSGMDFMLHHFALCSAGLDPAISNCEGRWPGQGPSRGNKLTSVLEEISAELEAIRAQNLWKTERPIVSPQSARI